MVYIYVKKLGNNNYYYLRASVKKGKRILTKDIAYLGHDITKLKTELEKLPQYKEDIKKSYRKLQLFIDSNIYLEKAKSLKLKSNKYITNDNLLNTEACKLHYKTKFLKEDSSTKEETFNQFIIELAYNTTSIEGNTISLKQAKELFENNKTPRNKDLREIYDLQNTKESFFWLLNEKPNLNLKIIVELHKKLVESIDKRTGIRTQEIRVFKSKFKSTPSIYVRQELEDLLEWYKNNRKKLHPLVLSSIFHHNFERIHPFMDGNGRTGRLIMNLILIKENYPLVIIRKKNRREYLDSLLKADQLKFLDVNEMYTDFINFVAEELSDTYWNIFL